MIRRVGRPGLVGTMARTAVIAGTASAVSGAVYGHQMDKRAEKQQEAYAEQQAVSDQQQSQAEIAAMQAQLAAMQQQPAAPAAAPAAGAGDEMMVKLQKLAELHNSGILDDAEFAAAKAKLLAG